MGASPQRLVADTVFAKAGRRVVVLGGGEAPGDECLAHWTEMAELFLAADWAALTYESLPRRPDAVIGDLDTLMGRTIDRDDPPFLRIEDQDTTDMEKCLLHALDLDCAEAVLLGATGGRLDHTLYNLSLAERFADRMRICVANDHGATVRIGAGETVRWDLPPGLPLSVSPLSAPALLGGVVGLRWPLADRVIAYGGEVSVSNETVSSPVSIEVLEGSVLASVGGWSPDRFPRSART